MRASQTCPKCKGKRFAVQNPFELHVPEDGSTRQLSAIAGSYKTAFGRLAHGHGHLETWTCLHCGYTEFYAALDPKKVAELAKKAPEYLKIVDATPPDQGPHR